LTLATSRVKKGQDLGRIDPNPNRERGSSI